MVASLVSAAGLPYLQSIGVLPQMGFAQTTILQVGFTTLCWLLAAYLAPQTDAAQLVAFYRKVHPAGPGWAVVRRMAEADGKVAPSRGDHMGLATIGWIAGCVVIWSSLFCIGNFLYGRMTQALVLLGVFIMSGGLLLYVVNHLWDRNANKAS